MIEVPTPSSTIKPQPVREAPRMSVHAVAEYIVSPPARGRTIVADQKKPKDFKVIFYSRPEHAIARCLASGGKDYTPLETTVRELRALTPTKRYGLLRRDTGIEAIGSFREMLKETELDVAGLKLARQRFEPIKISGVAVSVRPELLIVNEDAKLVGCVKLYFSKADLLSEERARYTATLLHQFVQEALGAGQSADWRRCYVLDVFGRQVWNASRTFTRRRKEVAAACATVRAIWPTI
jgi:hypothetical protein